MSLFRKCVTCGVERPMSELDAQGVCVAHRTPLKVKKWAEQEVKIFERQEREKEREKEYRCEKCHNPISFKEYKTKGFCKKCVYQAFK